MNLKENTELQNGKYRIIRVLGQGGFGITYLAENVFFNKIVAIKEFFPKSFCGRDNTSHLTLGTANNAETVEKLLNRFMKEAKNIAKLDHPGIVKIQDIFKENNTAYYVMDYIEGENLNEIVKRNGPLSEEKAVEYIKKVGEALSYIHSKNMTHFDVKPANIMIRRSDDTPILIDFGLSKQYDNSGDATSTMLNAVSQGYSPIELYNPGSLTEFSPQTDIYSLAATLLFLLTGKTPPSASDIAMEGLSFPSSITVGIKDIIESAMKNKRKERPIDIGLFVDNLYNLSIKKCYSLKTEQRNDEETKLLTTSLNKKNSILDPHSSFGNLSSLNDDPAAFTVNIEDKDKIIFELKEKLAHNESYQKELLSNIENLNKKSRDLEQKANEIKSECNNLHITVEDLEDNKRTLISSRNKWATFFGIAIIGLFISIPMCSHNYNELTDANIDYLNLNEKYISLQNQLSSKNNEISSKNNEIELLNNIITKITKSQSVFIEDMEVRNEGENYGQKIFSRNSTFINPRIKVINMAHSTKTLGVKFFAPWGLQTGKSSKNGYSYTEDLPADFSGWYEIDGWGNTLKGTWPPGNYRIEIWSDGKCIDKKSFRVY